MWPFKPLWKSSNPETRLKGFARLNPRKPENHEVLERIALKDDSYPVRQLAYRMLDRASGAEALADRALHDKKKSERLMAVRTLKDNKVILQVFKKDRSEEVKAEAFRILMNAREMEEGVLEVLRPLIARITDQQELAYIANYASNEQFARVAIDTLTDQRLLFDIIVNCDFQSISEIALEKLTDQEILAGIAIKAFDYDMEISRESEDKIRKLQKWLNKFYESDDNIEIMKKVIDKISDRKLLADIVQKTPNGMIRFEAERRLEEKSFS